MKDFLTDFIWAIAALQVLGFFVLSMVLLAGLTWLTVIRLSQEVTRAKGKILRRAPDIQTEKEEMAYRER